MSKGSDYRCARPSVSLIETAAMASRSGHNISCGAIEWLERQRYTPVDSRRNGSRRRPEEKEGCNQLARKTSKILVDEKRFDKRKKQKRPLATPREWYVASKTWRW
jgi:hypothetical protein